MRLSGPGQSGLHAVYIHLASLRGVSIGLMRIIDKIVNGIAPCWLADARLLAILKKDGGVRPIAVIEVLRSVAVGALLRSS